MSDTLSGLFADADMADMVHQLSSLAMKVMMGEDLKTKEYDVKVRIPTEIVAILQSVCDKTDMPIEKMLSLVASQGFETGLQGEMGKFKESAANVPPAGSPPVDILNAAKTAGIDLSALQEGMEQIGSLTKQLETLQQGLENASGITPEKDSE